MCYSVMVESSLKKIALEFNSEIDEDSFAQLRKHWETDPKVYKTFEQNPRIYPNYFAPVIIKLDSRRIIRPMRYRLRPHDSSEEVPSKYNMFNCRVDSLENRKSWRDLFMKNHGIIILKGFYEWVLDVHTGKKHVVRFSPIESDIMWAPVIWDHWQPMSAQEKLAPFDSFALVIREPPPEVLAAGHDRCPAHIHHEDIETWLTPVSSDKFSIKKILGRSEPVHYACNLSSP